MAAARHGAPTEMIGCLGNDLFGVQLRERLAAAGVGLGQVSTQVQGSGMSVALQERDGDYAAVVVSGANRGLQPAHDSSPRLAAAGPLQPSGALPCTYSSPPSRATTALAPVRP